MECWVSFLQHYGIHTMHTSIHYVLVWPSKNAIMYSETFSGCAPSQVCHFSVFLDCFAPNQHDNQPIKGLIERSWREAESNRGRNILVESHRDSPRCHNYPSDGGTVQGGLLQGCVIKSEEKPYTCSEADIWQRSGSIVAPQVLLVAEDSWDRIWVFYLCRWESSFQITHVRCAVGHLSSTWLSSNRLYRLFPDLNRQQLLLITRATMPKASVNRHRLYVVV